MQDSNDATIDCVRRELRHSGFDLCHPMHTSWYNDLIRGEGLVESGALEMLPEPSATPDDGEHASCNALLIGNTKRIWPVFLKWLASKVEQKKTRNRSFTDEEAVKSVGSPFDTFVEESISETLQHCFRSHSGLKRYEVFWSEGKRSSYSDDARGGAEYQCYRKETLLVSMLRVAEATGQYWNDVNATKLCVHPEYGTWTAFRAVVVLGTTSHRGSPPRAPPSCPCPLTDKDMALAKTVFDYALEMSSADENGYGATLNKSWEELSAYLQGPVCSGNKWEDGPDAMKPWIQLRDCISLGRGEWKYSPAQLLYHYTKDPDILRAELERIGILHRC